MQPENSPASDSGDADTPEQAASVIRRREAQFRAFIEHFPGVISRFDRQLRHLFVGGQIEANTGLKPSDFIGKTWRDLGMPIELITQWEEVVGQVFSTGKQAELHFSMAIPNGTAYYQSRLFPEFGADGSVESVFCMSREVTEETRAQRHLSESEERFRLAFESSPIGMVLSNDTLKYVKANAAFCQMLGYTKAELMKLTPLDIIYAEDIVEGRELSSQLISGEITAYTRQKRYIAKDGRLIWTRSTITILRDSDQRALYGLGMVEDISQQLQNEAELARYREQLEESLQARTKALEKSQKALRLAERLASLGTVAGGIVHEINNPIGAIMLAVESAQAALADGDDARLAMCLKSIGEDIVRTGRIVHNVMSYVQEQAVEKAPTSLNEVVRQAVERKRLAAEKAGAKLQLALAAEEARVLMNATSIEQAIGNVVQNAIEASPKDSVVQIATTFSDDFCTIIITDNGIGIPAELHDEIFKPFFSTRTQSGGVGLGLVRGAVSDHQGQLQLISTPGGGSQFRIVLPRYREPG